jgi:photosystem II stability/assembly factor-like uncharacterized protein
MLDVRKTLIALILVTALGAAVAAQDPGSRDASSAPASDKSAGTTPKELKSLKYRSIGPAAGGRISRVAGIPGDPTTYYAATASGGVWKSSDGGTTWRPIFDDQPISSIGSIAVSPSNPNVVYVGSGEANIRGNVAAGNGIYKSADAGKTWTHVWNQEGQIGKMVVHPTDPDIAFAAVLGHAFGPNPERGVYRTIDGGRTWRQVLRKNADAGASDVEMDPSNPSIIFAGFWQTRRLPWDFISGGPGSGLYVSHDGGDSWKQLTGQGLPDGNWGKVGVAVAPSDSRRVYALIEAEKGGLFRSDDGGSSWELVNPSRALRQRAWYYSTLTVNPINREDVWFPQVPMLRTIDGGKTLQYMKGIHHADHHDLWIDPKNPKRMITGNDGGVDISHNGGETWFAPPLPISQFYHVSADTRVPYHVAGAMQDIGTAQAPNENLRGRGIALSDWHGVGGGEAGHVVSNTSDPDIVFAGEYLGIITKYDHRTGQSRNVSAWPENPSGHGSEDMRFRFQWTAPIALSPHDADVVYHGAQVIFRTSNGGQSWEPISPDLTRNDKTKQKWAGGPITGDNTGVETYGTVFAIAESPRQKGVIWAGTDDGLVQITLDNGQNWTNVTAAMPGLPEWGTVSMIEPSTFEAGTAYVVVDAHRLDNPRPYLFKTTDLGRTWTRLDGKLEHDVYLHAVREDPAKKGLLYLGTERGVMFSTDDGATWRDLRLNLPTVAVHDLVVKGDDLVVGTHGRSLWILDDLQAVRELSVATRSDVHLFPVVDAVRWRIGDGAYGTRAASFSNPPRGASIYYYLKDKPKGELKIEILDAQGTTVRTLSSVVREPDHSDDNEDPDDLKKEALAIEPGVHRAMWDLAWQGATKITGGKIDTGDPREGPRAVPGPYTVRLTVDGKTENAPLRVAADPRGGGASQTELEAQLAHALRVRNDVSKLTGLVNDLRSVKEQLRSRAKALELRKSEPGMAELLKNSDDIIKKADALEDKLHNPTAEVVYDILAMRGGTRLYSRLVPLQMWAVESEGPPTSGMIEVLEVQEQELGTLERETREFIEEEVGTLNAAAARLGLSFVVVK